MTISDRHFLTNFVGKIFLGWMNPAR